MTQPDLMLQVDDSNRISAYYDGYGYAYEDFVGDSMGVYTLRKAHFMGDIKGGELTEDLDRLTRNTSNWQHESAIGKYLTISNKHYRKITLQGYSQGDWAEVFIYSDDDWVLDKDSDSTLQAWFKGDIFTVHHERLETYTSNTDPSNTISQWETVDSLSACIVESEEDLEAYISDFNLTITK